MAKKQVKYLVIRSFENDDTRHEAGTAVTTNELKGFTISYLKEKGLIRPLKEGEHGNGKN